MRSIYKWKQNCKKFQLTADEFLNGGTDMLHKKFGIMIFGDTTQADIAWQILRKSVYNAQHTVVYENIGWQMDQQNPIFVYANVKNKCKRFGKSCLP